MDQLGLRSCLHRVGDWSITARRCHRRRSSRAWHARAPSAPPGAGSANVSALDELLGVDFQTLEPMQLYRASDALMAASRGYRTPSVRPGDGPVRPCTSTITLYDLTNTYFEGEAGGQPKARRGHSKEKRTDCPLLTLGLVLDASGFVRRSQVFAGNVREHHTLAEMLDALNAPRGALVVMDRGIATEDRVQWLREQRYRYLVVSRERTRHFDAEASGAHRDRIESRRASAQGAVRGRSGGAPLLLLRGTRRQGTRYRRALRQTLRGRTDQALRGPVQTSYSETPRQSLAAHWSAQSWEAAASPSTTLSNSTPTTPDNAPPPCASLAARSAAR